MQFLVNKLNYDGLILNIKNVWNIGQFFSNSNLLTINSNYITVIKVDRKLVIPITILRNTFNDNVINFNLNMIWWAFNEGETGLLNFGLILCNLIFSAIFKSYPCFRLLLNSHRIIIPFYYRKSLFLLFTH